MWDMAMRGLFCSIALVCISGVRLDFSRLRHNSTHFLGVAVLCGISRPRCNDFGLSLLATLLSFASAFLPSFPDSLRWGVQRRRAMQRVNGIASFRRARQVARPPLRQHKVYRNALLPYGRRRWPQPDLVGICVLDRCQGRAHVRQGRWGRHVCCSGGGACRCIFASAGPRTPPPKPQPCQLQASQPALLRWTTRHALVGRVPRMCSASPESEPMVLIRCPG